MATVHPSSPPLPGGERVGVRGGFHPDVTPKPRVKLEVTLRRLLGPDYRMGFLFVAPIVVLVLALVAYPFCYAVYLSMTRKYVGMPPVWVGLENYIGSPTTASSSARSSTASRSRSLPSRSRRCWAWAW